MKGLSQLLRLRKYKVDEQKMVLQKIADQIAFLVAQLEQISQDINAESHLRTADPSWSIYYYDFLQTMEHRKKILQLDIIKLEEQLQNEQDKLRLHFSDLKATDLYWQQLLQEKKKIIEQKEEHAIEERTLFRYQKNIASKKGN